MTQTASCWPASPCEWVACDRNDKISAYVLGHSASERARLGEQGVILRPFTERLLRDAGIGPGMAVLDAGCGTGDLTLLVAG